MPKEELETIRMDIPVIKGSDPVFVLAICVLPNGDARLTFNAAEGVNYERVGMALREFSSYIKGGPKPQA